MSTRTLNTRKIEHIFLSDAELAAEQQAKIDGGYSHLSDEQFRDLVSRDILLIEGPISAPDAGRMTADQIDELIRIRTEEKSQCLITLKSARSNLRMDNAKSRLRELNEEIADLQRRKTHLMESAA